MRERVKVSEDLIREAAAWTEVLQLCAKVSGRNIKEIAWDCGWRDGGKVLSRILRDAQGDDQRYMPHDKLIPFMVACGNAAPLWWLMYELEATMKDDPRNDGAPAFALQFAEEQQECRRLLTEILSAVKSADPSNARPDVHAHFCLVERDVLPTWLVQEGMQIVRLFGEWLGRTYFEH